MDIFVENGDIAGHRLRSQFFRARLAACIALIGLSGCSTSFFSHDGPSLDAVRDGARGTQGSYSLVELNARTDAIIEAAPVTALLGLGSAGSTAPVDRIGVGDGLTVTVFDRGPEALFATSGVTNGIGGVTVNGIPKLFVNTQGDIILPYGGQIHVAGLTVAEAGSAIQDALKGKAINPQVVVSIADNIANSVTVVGEVRSPGRYALADGSDHILDMLALAGGAVKPPEDVNVVVVRGMAQATASLSDLLSNNSQNIRLAPHDQVRLFYTPRKFSTFGALMRSAQIPIEDPSLTLAAALSKAGGLDPDAANASSVLLFRFERPQVAAALALNAPVSAKGVPIVYHVNMRNPEEMFVANRFEIKSGDIIYVPRTDIAEMKQFLAIVTAASNVAYNIRVTTAVVP